MKKITLCKGNMDKGNLILVNEGHPLKGQVNKTQLTPASSLDPTVLMEWQAARMLEKARAHSGCRDEILAVSGYRSQAEQEAIYAEALQEHGLDFTQKYVALPGCSEHQTGLAVDLGENKGKIDFLRPDFPYDGICGEFRQVSVQYGFIERYPLGGEAITKIAHEPWHFRYVGYPHSALISEQEMTLEEYTEDLQQYVYQDKHLFWSRGRQTVEIFYVPLGHGKETLVEVPDTMPCQVSGNNAGGVVVTLWR